MYLNRYMAQTNRMFKMLTATIWWHPLPWPCSSASLKKKKTSLGGLQWLSAQGCHLVVKSNPCLCLLVVSSLVYEMTDDLHETRSQTAEVCVPPAHPFHSEDVYIVLAGDVEISMLKPDEYIQHSNVFQCMMFGSKQWVLHTPKEDQWFPSFLACKPLSTKKCLHVAPHKRFFFLMSSASRPHHSCHHHRATRFPSRILPFENRLLRRQGLPGLLLWWHPRFWRLSHSTAADWRRIPSLCHTVYPETVACCLLWVSECL